MGAYESISSTAGTDVNQDGIVSPTDAMYVINRLGSADLTADADVTAIQNALRN